MKYLNEEELLKSIEEYINIKTDYAILVDGAWGCGKTYFAENTLIKKLELENKEIVNVSLYGITSKKEIDEKIIEKQLSDYPKYGKILKFGYKFSSGLFNLATVNVNDKNMKDILNQVNMKDILDKISVLKDKILIFDDLERCSLSFNEILGYINEYVEHENCKVIIIANQKEITKNNFMKNIELKYLTVKSFDTEYIPTNEIASESKKIDQAFDNNYESKNETNKYVSKQQLNNRILELYSENLEYKQIKEKVIGRTFYYEPNLKNVLKNILEKSNMRKKDKKFILTNADKIIDILKRQNHINIRTLKFSIEIFEKVIKIFNKMKIEESKKNVFEECKINVLMYTVYASALEKSGTIREYWRPGAEYDQVSIGKSMINYMTAFKFIDEIIDIGYVDEQKIVDVINNYIEDIFENNRNDDNPLNLLKNYWEMDDDEILKCLKELKKQITNLNYKIRIFPGIIEILVKLKGIGFNDKIIEEILNILEENILKHDDMDYFYDADVNFQNKKESDEYEKIVTHFKEIMNVNYIESREHIMDKLLDEENWGEKLAECIMEHRYDDFFGNRFLSLFNIEKLINKIIASNTRNISNFRRIMASLYRIDNIKDIYMLDFENMVNLKDAIEKELQKHELGKTKIYNYKLIVELLNDKIAKFK